VAEVKRGFSKSITDAQHVSAAIPRVYGTGLLRLKQIIGDRTADPPIPALIPIGRSTWLEGVRKGRYPQPIKGLGKRITVWRIEDILALIHEIPVTAQDSETGRNCAVVGGAAQEVPGCRPPTRPEGSSQGCGPPSTPIK
jgi:predicted DNA-binding transcriptional regulator AlpA